MMELNKKDWWYLQKRKLKATWILNNLANSVLDSWEQNLFLIKLIHVLFPLMEILLFPPYKRFLPFKDSILMPQASIKNNSRHLSSKVISMSPNNICERIKSPWNTSEDIWWMGREILFYSLILQTEVVISVFQIAYLNTLFSALKLT